VTSRSSRSRSTFNMTTFVEVLRRLRHRGRVVLWITKACEIDRSLPSSTLFSGNSRSCSRQQSVMFSATVGHVLRHHRSCSPVSSTLFPRLADVVPWTSAFVPLANRLVPLMHAPSYRWLPRIGQTTEVFAPVTSSVTPTDSRHRASGRHQRCTRDKSHWPRGQPSNASDPNEASQLDNVVRSAGKLDDAKPTGRRHERSTRASQLGSMVTLAGKLDEAKSIIP
jgi:hypothetical protein